MIQVIESTCSWCEEKATFNGEDPEQEWRESGWFIQLAEDGTEREFCTLSCCISAQ